MFTLLAFGLGGTIWQWRSAVNKERRANRLLKDLDDALFDLSFNYLFAGKRADAESIADTLNDHEKPILANKLKASLLIFEDPNLKEATRILEQARKLDPNDPGLIAMLMFTYGGRGDHVDRPYSQAGMAIISSLTGQYDQTQNRSIARHLIRDYDIPELIALGLDVLIFSGATVEEVESHAKEASHRLRAKKQQLDSWGNRYAERVLAIYADEYDDTLLRDMAKLPSAKLWSSYAHWALAMRSLAEGDLDGAHAQLENVIEQRVIYLANYLWARAILERWGNVAAARAANG